MVTVLDHGAVANDSSATAKTANSAAFQEACDAGGDVLVPRGIYYMDGVKLSIRASVHLFGEGGGGWYCPSILIWPPTSDGIVVESDVTSGDGRLGAWSIIERLAIKQQYRETAASPFHGLTLHTIAEYRNLWINGWSGKGVHIEGTTPNANPNLWVGWNCQIDECYGDGLHVEGGDANAGVAIGISVTANGGTGIKEASSLGNTFIACHARSNTVAPYTVPGELGVNNSTFVGCYAEADQPPITLAKQVHWWGGTVASGMSGGVRVSAGNSALYLSSPNEGETALRVIGAHGNQAVPQFTLENETESVMIAAMPDGTLTIKPYAKLSVMQIAGQPAVQFSVNDQATGYVGPVGDLVFSSTGGGYGAGQVQLRMVGTDALPHAAFTLQR